MSTTVTYKGNTLTTATNQTRTLQTAGKYLEDDITITDSSSSAAVSVVDTTDTHGGTIRTITAVDLSSDTVTASVLGSGYTAHDAQGNVVNGQANISTPTLQTISKSYTPSETAQSETITAGTGYDAIQQVDVSVGAISSTYVGSGITSRSSSDLTASGATVTVPAGYYASQATKSVTSGSAGTPTASKGTVSNHSVTVTPSVTNSTGYITGGTKTGAGVTVSASELASGNKEITSNGSNIDVVGYSTVSVNVSGGSSKNVQYVMGTAYVQTNGYTSTGMSITVAKTGTYKVSWAGWRSSSQGTMGTNLYRNNTAGTNQQTFTNTYGQCITLNNQSYTAGDVLTLYATAGSTSRYMRVANLIIEEQ